MSPPDKPAEEAQQGEDDARGNWLRDLGKDIIAQLLPLVVSAGGLAALVFGVGGAVSLARFYAAGMPAQQALDAATESDVRAVGLTLIIVFAMLGLLAVVLAYLASPEGRATAAMYYLLIALAAVEASLVWMLGIRGRMWGDLMWQDIVAAGSILVATGLALLLIWILHRRAGPPESTPSLVAPAKKLEGKDPEHDPTLVIPLWAYAILGVLSVAAGVLIGALLGHWWVALSIMFAGVLGLTTIRVADMCRGFRWYGVCVFFSVLIFGSVVGVLRMLEEPRLQPVAFLLSNGDRELAVQGIYVGQSDDRLWFASVALSECGGVEVRRGSGRLMSVPQSRTSYVTIGPSMGLPRLAHESQAMLDDVMDEHPGPEGVMGPGAVRDAVAVNELGKIRKTAGWWLRLGSREDLGSHPVVRLKGRRLRIRQDPKDDGKWDVRLARVAATGPVYVNCGERTNRAWLTVSERPLAMPSATDQGDGTWRLEARGSVDPDGQLDKYTWQVGDATIRGRSVELPADRYAPTATLIVEDDDRLKDDRSVQLTATVARTFPSDLLFCFDCRRLASSGARRVRAMRHDIVGARLVRIRVHTDERGSEAHNRDLSEARARAVKRALLKGVRQPPVVRAVGMGERDPSEEGDHRRNRRIEVLIYRGSAPV